MSYTPTTQQVEDGFAHEPEYEYHDPVNYGSHVQSNRRAFKRWLTTLISEAKAEAWDEGHDAGWNSRDDDATRGWVPSGIHESDAVNPYREGSKP